MRIISGLHKGKRISAPKNLPVRPTTDMAKEALFNVLNNLFYFEDICVLDLFSGTGNISYEFASRGTENIYSVDNQYKCVRFINQTAKKMDMNIVAYKANSYSFLAKTSLTFDVIFADPPYNFEKNDFVKIIDLAFTNNLLNNKGLLVIEHSKHTELNLHPRFSYKKRYGGSVFSFFEFINN